MKVLSNSALSKTLTVSNMEPPGEVVKTLLQESAELGDAQNLQLVLSNSDDLSSSLIGQENTCGIKTNQLDKEQAKCDLSSGNLERKPLKPSEKSCCQVQHSQDARLKHCKKNKRVSWPFRKNSGSESTSSLNGLFDRPLKDICDHNDNLAKPILDILMVLFQKGRSTVGIFRKSANLKACKELIGKLNMGKEVTLEEEPVIQLAAVFKDFLRRIPNSVLVTELYDSWMVNMEEMPFEERVAKIKQLLAKLPSHNCLLLRYVFCVLYHINKHSQVNKMNAYNLAVCIGPNMLWTKKLNYRITENELQKEVTSKVVTLMQFLIENCCQIFGNEITTILGEPEDIDNLDISCHQNDSAYDSTDQDDWKEGENEKRQRANSSCYQLSRSHERLRMAEKQNCQTDITDGVCVTASCSNESIDANSRVSFRPNATTCPSGLINRQLNVRADRRSSEPTLAVAFNPKKINQQELVARSHDDCSVPFVLDFTHHLMRKQVSEESFTRREISSRRPDNFNASSHSELSTASSSKASSVSSLASSCSNMSESSVFISSPLVSPTCCSQENYVFSDHLTKLQTNSIQDPNSCAKSTKEKAKKSVKKTYSWGPSRTLNTNQEPYKENTLRENLPTCQTVHEDQVDDSDTARFRTRIMSADEVFQRIDSKKRCSPPSYTKAIEENSPPIPSMKEMTVKNMRKQFLLKEHTKVGCRLVAEQKGRPYSLTEELLQPLYQNQINLDSCNKQTTATNQCEAFDSENVLHLTRCEKAHKYRGRAMSESAGRSKHKLWSTQAFEFQYAKESYV
ncbi:T cell activation RhoGTPase activating protein b [Pristis pectinata]|uniref:T cell activation RhoGTPase activating protein b n=1 Tax=Pristis pectinata TaxID=685728 RepID=UPI00223E5EA6|nr:T cell activation RhoGTPase activating protein b [Pristis pectinata]